MHEVWYVIFIRIFTGCTHKLKTSFCSKLHQNRHPCLAQGINSSNLRWVPVSGVSYMQEFYWQRRASSPLRLSCLSRSTSFECIPKSCVGNWKKSRQYEWRTCNTTWPPALCWDNGHFHLPLVFDQLDSNSTHKAQSKPHEKPLYLDGLGTTCSHTSKNNSGFSYRKGNNETIRVRSDPLVNISPYILEFSSQKQSREKKKTY